MRTIPEEQKIKYARRITHVNSVIKKKFPTLISCDGAQSMVTFNGEPPSLMYAYKLPPMLLDQDLIDIINIDVDYDYETKQFIVVYYYLGWNAELSMATAVDNAKAVVDDIAKVVTTHILLGSETNPTPLESFYEIDNYTILDSSVNSQADYEDRFTPINQ